MKTFKQMALVAVMVMALGAGFGCAKKQVVEETPVTPTAPVVDNTGALDAAERAISDGIVYFDFDKFSISDNYREVLREKAELIKAHPSIRVRIEGNCDARGTQEYNLALGERRARAVYEYLVMLGVNPAQMEMISYGKERPAVEGTGDAVWAQNRRDDFRVIAR